MLTVDYAHSPQYADNTGNCISMQVKFFEINEELPFGATNYDDMAYGRDLYARALAGEFGLIAPYVAPEPPTATQAQPQVTGAQTL